MTERPQDAGLRVAVYFVVGFIVLAILVGTILVAAWLINKRMSQSQQIVVVPGSPPQTTVIPAPASTSSETVAVGEVRELIERWRSAWSNQNLTQYMACYAPDFSGTTVSKTTGASTFDYNGWQAYKRSLFQKNRWIDVTLGDISITIRGNEVTARFMQYYSSSIYSDTGYKTLHLLKRGGVLQIVREECA